MWMDKVAFRSCQRRNKMRRINKQSKTAESLAFYLSSVEIANNEKKRSRLDFEHKLGNNIKTGSKSLYGKCSSMWTKIKRMHFGFSNTRHTYTMNNKELQTVSEEKYLGVIIQDNLKVDKQVAASVAKANKMQGII